LYRPFREGRNVAGSLSIRAMAPHAVRRVELASRRHRRVLLRVRVSLLRAGRRRVMKMRVLRRQARGHRSRRDAAYHRDNNV